DGGDLRLDGLQDAHQVASMEPPSWDGGDLLAFSRPRRRPDASMEPPSWDGGDATGNSPAKRKLTKLQWSRRRGTAETLEDRAELGAAGLASMEPPSWDGGDASASGSTERSVPLQWSRRRGTAETRSCPASPAGRLSGFNGAAVVGRRRLGR